jgi:hypothetical protein
MNNASKGRCVTVTPRGKSEDEILKAKPVLRKGQYWYRERDGKGISQKITKATKTDLRGGNRGDRDVGGFGGGVFWPGGSGLPGTPLSRQKFHCPTIAALIYPW